MENILITQQIPDKETQLILRKINTNGIKTVIQNPSNLPEPSSNFIQEYTSSPGFLKQSESIIKPENKSYKHKPFIEANTTEINLPHLKQECIIPVFSKDNERTIAHQEFIEITQNCIGKIFPHHSLEIPEIRVSHQIKGRIPEAIHKNAKDLLDHEKTIYYERMAFIIRIPSITEDIQGNPLELTIGGVRAYNQENLYNKKTMEKFKFFIGFQNLVCCNLCVNSDGYVEDMRVSSYQELQNSILQVLQKYEAERHIFQMKQLPEYSLTEQQFAQLLGKTRLYQHLPKKEKENLQIPELIFNDSQFSTIAKDYYLDESFCRDSTGNINLWKVYNLFTQANKSSYIDTFLERNVNALNFTENIQKTMVDKSYHWFLS